ncbi:MAG: hypothetical protein QM731_09415 [Chitinophagaceae bacterium]
MQEQEQQHKEESLKVTIDNTAFEHLRSIAGWARTVAILGIVSSGLSFVNTILRRGGGAELSGNLITLVLTVLLNILLLRFAHHTTEGLQQSNQAKMNEGVNNLNAYFKFWGIMALLVLSLAALVFMMMAFFGMGRALTK